MTTALALVRHSEVAQAIVESRESAPPPSRISQTRARTTDLPFVYGDSTAFPYDWNCIETIHDAVACCVDLLKVQNALIRGRAREGEIERRRQMDRVRLSAMGESIKRTTQAEGDGASEAVTRTGIRIVAAARAAIEAEQATLESEAQAELAGVRDATSEARMRGFRALERVLAKHEMPGSRVGYRLVAKAVGYAVEALVAAPFGVSAVFELSVLPTDPWARRRRVAELAPDLAIRVPREAGWFAKRMEMSRLALDKLYVLAASADGERGMLILGRQPRAGAGYEIEIDAKCDPPQVRLAELAEDGKEITGGSFALGGEDRMRVVRLWRSVRESLADVLPRRSAMISATVDDRVFEGEEPHLIAKRMVDALAPIVGEVSRRSGAAGELVLRRNVRSGRRDEIYVTKAELLDMVMTLPPPLRAVFDRLELASAPRSPRAPSVSVPSYEEVSAELILD